MHPVSPLAASLRGSPTWQIAATVFFNLLCYITIGLPLAVIPSFTHHILGFDAVIAGFAVSIQYLATFISRPIAGRMADTVGPKRSVLTGLAACAGSGLLLLLSGLAEGIPILSLAMLVLSRGLLGCGESCTSTGCITWAIGRVGFSRAAQVISFNGITSYGGIAIGAPLGLAIAGRHGMVPLGLLTMALGILGFCLAIRRPGVTPSASGRRVAFRSILRMVAPYGAVLAMSSVGFGVIAAFITLFYDQQHWHRGGAAGAGAALSVFGLAFVVTRLLFAGQIGRRGGLPVGMMSLAVETLGLLLLWQAWVPALAVLGCALTGAGFALVFPALGVLAVEQVAPQSRGSAIGAYSVFLDISIGVSGPILGLIAKGHGYASLFLSAACACGVGLTICFWLRHRNSVRG